MTCFVTFSCDAVSSEDGSVCQNPLGSMSAMTWAELAALGWRRRWSQASGQQHICPECWDEGFRP